MEQPAAKRVLRKEIEPQHENPDVARLATIGMRIRKSVSDGYSIAHEASYKRDYEFQPKSQQSFMRVPLPGNVDAPPSLTNQGSTFQSGLNVSEWGAPSMPLNVLPPNASGLKRRFDDYEDESSYSLKDQGPSLEQYVQTYGELKFDDYSF